MPYEVAKIIDLVKARQFERGVATKIQQMDQDLDFYDMIEFNTNAVDGTPLGSNFRSFTSNEPRTYADKLISLLVSGETIINIPYGGSSPEERERFDKAERFWAGSFEQADDRLEKALKQRLEVQLATQLSLRGTCAARVLIRNRDTDESFVDIRPFDPRHSVWESSDEGLLWFCYVSNRTVAQLRAEYPKAALPFKDTEVLEVYDFYDEKYNVVLAEGTTATTGAQALTLKKRTEHGDEDVPVVITPGGSYSGLKAGPNNRYPTVDGYGESIFASVRLLYPILNEVMSIYLELVAKARDQTFVLYSDDDVEIEDNPNEAGATLHLGQRDKFTPLEIPETTKDAAQLVGLVQAMIQRGTLPQTAFGELAFQLSGFAITQLRQSLFSTMEPNLLALSVWYRQTANKLAKQLRSDKVNPMELSGADQNKQWFRETFTKADMENIPNPVVKIVPQLPQDDQQKVALANAMRQSSGPEQPPLLPDSIILDQILEVKDAGRIQEMVKEQMAERLHPAAVSLVMAKIALDRDRQDLAQIYLDELQKQLNPPPPVGPTGPGGPGLPGGGPPPELLAALAAGGPTGPLGPGLPPQVLPPEASGIETRGRVTQGPQVPPGSPRPGAIG